MIFAQDNLPKTIAELKTRVMIESPKLQNDYQLIHSVPEKKSPGLAIIYSFLLPGMGELYAGDYSTGQYFTIADGVLWGFLFGFNTYGNWQENNYKSFLRSEGGGNPIGKDEDFFANVGLYVDIDQYNRRQELDRNFNAIYDEEKYYWKWDSQNQRREYRSMWLSSENAYNNLRFAAGALLLNRVVSIINAVRLVSAHNRELTEKPGLEISFGVDNSPDFQSRMNIYFRSPL